MPSIATRFVGQISLVAIGPATPSVEDWERFLAQQRAGPAQGDTRAVLVWSAGGLPSSLQRGDLKRLQDDSPYARVPTAALVDSRLGRGVVTALAWMGVDIAAFRPDDIEGALAYLAETATGVDPAAVRQALDALKIEVAT